MTAGPNIIEIIDADPSLAFKSTEKMESYIAALEAKAKETTAECSVGDQKGRDAIASAAYAIARKKTTLDNAGAKLKEDAQKRVNEVNEMRRTVKDRLQDIQDAIRSPLTQWETQEKARVESCKAIIEDLKSSGVVSLEDTAESVKSRLARIDAIEITNDDFQEWAEIAFNHRASTLTALRNAYALLLQQEKDRAELAKIRAEQEAREAEEQERAALAELEKRQREEDEARKRAQDAAAAKAAEDARIAAEAEAAAEKARIAAAHQAEIDKLNAEKARLEKESADKEAAAAAEKARIEAETRRREQDQAHRSTIMRAAKEAIMSAGPVDEESAKKIVLCIAAGNVPNVTIKF